MNPVPEFATIIRNEVQRVVVCFGDGQTIAFTGGLSFGRDGEGRVHVFENDEYTLINSLIGLIDYCDYHHVEVTFTLSPRGAEIETYGGGLP